MCNAHESPETLGRRDKRDVVPDANLCGQRCRVWLPFGAPASHVPDPRPLTDKEPAPPTIESLDAIVAELHAISQDLLRGGKP